MDESYARVLLARAPGLGIRHLRSLLDATAGDLTRLDQPGLGAQLPPAAAAFLRSPHHAALRADLQWLQSRSGDDARVLLCTDADFPAQLRHIAGCPATLYVLGDRAALQASQLAVVGSRRPTPAGRHTAASWVRQLVQAGLAITSGLAEGIDALSHEAALDSGGVTLAVCGTGLDRIFPRQHTALAQRICSRGALLSEFPPGTPPRGPHFARRNRLISGLALGTLVVEASLGSGSLVTARHAQRQGRSLLAVPGSIYSEQSAGCHQLIRAGAACVTSAAEVLLHLGISARQQRVISQTAPPAGAPGLDKGLEMLLDAVGFEPVSIDALAARTGLAGEAIASMLLLLELEGRIAPCPGGRYGRIP
ncbi:MAG: DNA-protecting protein DprA [Sinobacteraceae bacterium]|nr:DNA-protecting protein DprA [Nevskiaceae bacterium]